MPFIISPNFLDNFKIGDNINYNLKILKLLYENYNNHQNGKLLVKPIVIINTSIIEALLFDFIENRIRKANRTEMLFENILEVLKSKKLDKFEHYISQAKKYDFFSMKDTDFYNAMDSLRKKRNRVHIQNSKFDVPSNESEIFNIKSKELSEKVLEKTLTTLLDEYSRREEYHNYVEDFHLPWDKHFN